MNHFEAVAANFASSNGRVHQIIKFDSKRWPGAVLEFQFNAKKGKTTVNCS